ncbi:unnamed protein product [Cladocopium goreaui]|uniref:Uncharacterized protein n=1 Tax=Cladocopium goreaui TaxID=2562237 RepID=A0A9P1BN24_9DINO|nr:unnamed protein product [Cladocopium goreaui]
MASPEDCRAYKAETFRLQEERNLPLPYFDAGFDVKHDPYIVLNGTVGKVLVGKGAVTGHFEDPIHPMEDDRNAIHYIETIWVEDQDGNLLSMRHLSPAEPSPATMIFEIPPGTTQVRAFEFCNRHGLYRGPSVSVLPSNILPDAKTGCSVQQCTEGTSVSACQAFTFELFRRDNVLKNDPTGERTPFLTLNGSQATIVIGNETGLVLEPSNDWVSHVFALDDLGNLVALCELLPSATLASCSFELPAGIIFLRPFVFNTEHGLYVGDTVQVAAASATLTGERSCSKRECSASQPSLGEVPLRSAAVDALAKSQQESQDRISSLNMCNQHSALYFIAQSLVAGELSTQINRLTSEGTTDSNVAERLELFPALFAELNALGGRWSGLDVAIEHTIQDANGTSPQLRLELILEAEMLFSQRILSAGRQTFADGMSVPIENSEEDLLIIEAVFGMDWGYSNKKSLGPHYTIFYSPDFVNELVNVTLCAKTHGWMGIGWLSPSHTGLLMNHTDMSVAFIQDGVAVVQDRFARSIEEPLRDEVLANQRSDDLGSPLNGRNDLKLISGALGSPGKEWCPDLECKTGFTLVQFQRPFDTADASDLRLPVNGAKIGLIHAFATRDPVNGIMIQHTSTSTGYVDLQWNLECSPGTYFEVTTIECKPCDKGFFRPATSPVWRCLQAPFGSFQNETGQAVVKRCKDGFTTASAGATHEFACVCPGPSLTAPDGRYHVDICDGKAMVDELGQATLCARLGECLECPEGMDCKGSRDLKLNLDAKTKSAALNRVEIFCSSYAYADTAACTSRVFCESHLDDMDCEHAPPELKAGFWSHSSQPLSVFKCKNELQCIGGKPTGSICASGREGRSCGFCMPNHFSNSLGQCTKCGDYDAIPAVVAMILLLLAIGVLGWQMGRKISKSSKQVISATIIGTQAGVMIQTLGVFSDLSLVWEEPVRSLLQLMQLINFDFDIIKMSCYVGTDDPLLNIVVLLLVIPTLTVCGALLAALLARWKGQQFSWPKYLNVVGLVFLVLYLSICMSLTRPIHCQSNPNGLHTMVSSPAVLCWAPGPHVAMAVLSLGGLLLYGAGFLAYVTHITWCYPALVDDGHGLKLLVQYRFLFGRFKDPGYYWGFYFIVQKVLIAVIPILFPNSAAIQILLLAGFILLYLLGVTFVQPWVTDIANFADCFLNAGLIFFLLIASFLVDGNDKQTRTVIGVILLFLVLAITLAFGLLVLRAFYQKLFPSKMYDIFLCHHKAGAGVLCRWLKSKLLQQSKGQAKVFLDSDELEGLADIGDIVKSQSEALVIVASKQILTRPWCAVEICSAVANKVDIMILQCSDFKFYDGEGFEALREGWTSSDLLIFAQNAIDPLIIEESYRVLPGMPLVEFNAFGTEAEMTSAVASLLPLARPSSGRSSSRSSTRSSGRSSLVTRITSNASGDLEAEIVILGQTVSSEGRMTCLVLKSMVMERLRRSIMFVTTVCEASKLARNAKYILVVLTGGLFQDQTFLKMLEALEQANPQLEIVSALADQAFEFPSAGFFVELENSYGLAMVQSVKRVVNILALPFTAQTSMKVMSAQVGELTRRFKFAQMSSSDIYFDQEARPRTASNDEGTPCRDENGAAAFGGTITDDALGAQPETDLETHSQDLLRESTRSFEF